MRSFRPRRLWPSIPTSPRRSCFWEKIIFMRGRDYDATGPLERAIELKPEMAEPYFLIGQAYKNRGRLEEAMEYFSMAVQKDPSYVGAYVALGQMLIEVAQLNLARQVLTKAVELDKSNASARFLLGTAMVLDGDEKGARSQIQALKLLDPKIVDKNWRSF